MGKNVFRASSVKGKLKKNVLERDADIVYAVGLDHGNGAIRGIGIEVIVFKPVFYDVFVNMPDDHPGSGQ